MKTIITFLVMAIIVFLVAATSEARGQRIHKIPKDHKHKSVGRCLDKGVWVQGVCK